MLLVSTTIATRHSPATFHGDPEPHLARRSNVTTLTPKTDLKAADRAAHLAWLDWVEARLGGMSDTALAKKSGQSENVLTRFRTRDGATLSGMTISVIKQFSGLPGPDTYLLASPGLSEEALRFQPQPKDDAVTLKMIDIALKDRPNAASWRLKTHALEYAGYLPGDVLISDAAVTPYAGEAVVAQLYEVGSASAETIFRIIEPPYLVAATRDQALRAPLLIDNKRVIVMGAITQSFRFRQH